MTGGRSTDWRAEHRLEGGIPTGGWHTGLQAVRLEAQRPEGGVACPTRLLARVGRTIQRRSGAQRVDHAGRFSKRLLILVRG